MDPWQNFVIFFVSSSLGQRAQLCSKCVIHSWHLRRPDCEREPAVFCQCSRHPEVSCTYLFAFFLINKSLVVFIKILQKCEVQQETRPMTLFRAFSKPHGWSRSSMLCQMRSLDVIFASFCELLEFFCVHAGLAMGTVKSDSPSVQAVLGMFFLSFLRLSGGMRRRLAVGGPVLALWLTVRHGL